jgi:uncharacterized protein (DUF2062 family)
MAFGVFTGMMPIMPFQIAVAVALAIFFKGSKITAALGTWISNPLSLYFVYKASYKLGAFLLGLPEQSEIFSSVMTAIQSGEESMVVVDKILGAGGVSLAAFLLGGLVMGTVAAFPTYFIFLPVFTRIRAWRRARRKLKN